MRKPLKLLIVDDNPADANLIRRKIDRGFGEGRVETVHCLDSAASLQALQASRFHCVLLDYLLGPETGLDLLERIVELAPDLPVLILTGEGDETVAVQALKIGAVDYLIKGDLKAKKLALAIQNAIDQAALRAELKDKRRELEDFTYTAAHDLKAPLAIINQTAQLLELNAEQKGQNGDLELVRTIVATSGKLAGFIEELLGYAKSGRASKKLEQLSLQEVIQDVLTMLAVQIADTKATVHVSSELPDIVGDVVAMRQLFQNLISNALKFGRPGVSPEVTIDALELDSEEDGYRWKVCVADNGVGIGESDAARVFSPLVRLDATRDQEGTGLGLAIARKIMTQHGGDIWLESELGIGTKFFLIFP